MDFCDTFNNCFRAAHHNVSGKARCYLAGLLMKAPRKNMERMEEYVEDYNYQAQQQFLSDSPWDHHELLKRVGKEVDALMGEDPMLLIDESCFEKKGKKSVGVARQWNGRLGKVENSQVGVFAALSDGRRSSLIDARLFLPKEWTEDAARCDGAKIPEKERLYRTKPELAWEMIFHAQANGLSFSWVGLDSLYGNTPWLLRDIEDAGLLFAADVHRDQMIYLADPDPYVPGRKAKSGPEPVKLRGCSKSKPVRIDGFFEEVPEDQWEEVDVRAGTKGDIRVRACGRRVWLWDGEEEEARQWWAVCCIDNSTGEKTYFLSNAPGDVSLTLLVRRHAVRFWIERSFQDAKTSVGMADYQARGWTAWHHHMAMVMLGMLFLLRERKLHEQDIDLLSCQDIVELLNIYLPRTDRTKEAVIESMRQRHAKRRASIESARRKQRSSSTVPT